MFVRVQDVCKQVAKDQEDAMNIVKHTGVRLLFVLTIYCVVCDDSLYATPNIIVSPKSVDLGVFKEKSYSISKTVYLRNTGSSRLTIKRVHAGCGCIKASLLDGPIVDAGNAAKVELVLDANKAARGPHTYDVQIISDDPDTPIAKIEIGYTYSPDFELSSSQFLIYPDAGKKSANTIRIVDWSQELIIRSVSSSNQFLEYAICEVNYTPTDGRKLHYMLVSAVLAPGLPIGRINEKLILETNHPEHKEIVLPVKGQVAGPVRITPSMVLLRNLRRGSEFNREVVLGCDSDILIEEIVSSSESIKVESQHPAFGGKITLKISGRVPHKDREDMEGFYSEAIYIKFTKPVRYRQAIKVWGPIEENN